MTDAKKRAAGNPQKSASAKASAAPIEPMEARSVDAIPTGDQWQYEPKWDGFRCLLERNGKSVTLTSKSGQDPTRYFPEVAVAAASLPERRFVLDGELVIEIGGRFSDDLLQRIHPAASRATRLSLETPALFLAFDLLRRGPTDLLTAHLPKRRRELELFAANGFGQTLFRLSPATRKIEDAKRWLQSAGGGSDGVIAKRLDLSYQAGNRDGMKKIKRHRSADCVVGGFRYSDRAMSGREVVGSLLDEGALHHVGFTSALRAEEKTALTERLEAISAERSFTGATPGGPSRWSTRRSSEWVPVKPKLVVKCPMTTSPVGAFAMEPPPFGGDPIRSPANARCCSCSRNSYRPKPCSPDHSAFCWADMAAFCLRLPASKIHVRSANAT